MVPLTTTWLSSQLKNSVLSFINSLNNISHSDNIWLHYFSPRYSRMFAALSSEIIMHEISANVNLIVQVCFNTNQILVTCRDVLAMADWHTVSHRYSFQTWYASWPVKSRGVTVTIYVACPGTDATASTHAFYYVYSRKRFQLFLLPSNQAANRAFSKAVHIIYLEAKNKIMECQRWHRFSVYIINCAISILSLIYPLHSPKFQHHLCDYWIKTLGSINVSVFLL